MKRPEQAAEYFMTGNNCAQSVLLSFAGDLRFSGKLAETIASGFGAGMGGMQETCGAVTGAIMVLGMIHGEQAADNDELKSKAKQSVAELTRQFREEFGTTHCSGLTGCDLNTPEGQARFKEQGIKEKVCSPCVSRAVEIVERIART